MPMKYILRYRTADVRISDGVLISIRSCFAIISPHMAKSIRLIFNLHVSKMIADLEKEWNTALLERDRGGVHLTSTGEQILPMVRMMIDDYEKLKMKVDDIYDIEVRSLEIPYYREIGIAVKDRNRLSLAVVKFLEKVSCA